ncbi:MAG: helix-turn-helix transcriptional regulator [Oscillospiraceae bacterium]
MRKKYSDRERDERTPVTPWGKRIYKLLNEKHWTQNDLAEISHVPAPTLSGWLSNSDRKTSSEPKIVGFAKIAEAFGVSTDYLLGKHQCKTPSIEKTSKKIGLTDKSIEELNSLLKSKDKNDTDAYKKLFVINYLIENIKNTDLLINLYNYLFGEFYIRNHESGELFAPVQFTSKTYEKVENHISFSPIISESYLGSVQADLVRLKDTLNKEKIKRDKLEFNKLREENPDEFYRETTPKED